jgi:alpha-ribazole phosphatase
MTITRLWLIRHGEPEESVRQRCYGSLDVGLSARGQEQMADVAQHLSAEPIARVYSSPRSRALDGARAIAGSTRHVEVLADLREIDFGAFEGLAYDEIAARYPQIYNSWMDHPTEVEFPGGESYAVMRVRVLHALDHMLRASKGETVAVVTHGGVIRALIAWALGVPDEHIFSIGQRHGAVNLLRVTDGTPVVDLLNYRPGGPSS